MEKVEAKRVAKDKIIVILDFDRGECKFEIISVIKNIHGVEEADYEHILDTRGYNMSNCQYMVLDKLEGGPDMLKSLFNILIKKR